MLTDTRISDAAYARLVAATVRAPSIHNTQPWRLRRTGATIELNLDTSRALDVIDADSRGAVLSCGAALLNLRIALQHEGIEPVVELLPLPRAAERLASVRPGRAMQPTSSDLRLYYAIRRRRTYRGPFSTARATAEEAAVLIEAARQEGVTAEVLTPDRTVAVLAVEADAARRWACDDEYMSELWRWTDGHHDGVPVTAFGPRDVDVHAHLRDFGHGRQAGGRPTTAIDDAPLLLLLSSRNDETADRLRAGQAMQRVLLAATDAGLAATFLDQALERRALRWLLRDPVHGTGVPQVLLRIGRPVAPAPETPRRPLGDIAR